LSNWRFALCFQHNAPMRRRKRDTPLLAARISVSCRSHLMGGGAHRTIKMKNCANSKPAGSCTFCVPRVS
jgi:hypothetical protein